MLTDVSLKWLHVHIYDKTAHDAYKRLQNSPFLLGPFCVTTGTKKCVYLTFDIPWQKFWRYTIYGNHAWQNTVSKALLGKDRKHISSLLSWLKIAIKEDTKQTQTDDQNLRTYQSSVSTTSEEAFHAQYLDNFSKVINLAKREWPLLVWCFWIISNRVNRPLNTSEEVEFSFPLNFILR